MKLGKEKRTALLEIFGLLFLVLYPLRHINIGLDLWDTGYNYANFTYMGTEHMDSMWLFSTYLATAAGHLLTKLPGAGGLLGMNLYTGLFAGALAVMGYLFCTRRIGMRRLPAFFGEAAALSLCWCPTALLYNYLTYVLFLTGVILLYRGLTEERKGLLAAAGACLGANVLTRFSNLPEAALIVAVWVYDVVLCDRKERRAGFGRTLRHTGWCLAGYAASLAALLGYIGVRYGIGEYVAGIRRLFAMTDTAADYKADSMLMGMVNAYVENLYWVARIGVIVAAGMCLFAAAGLLTSFLEKKGHKDGAGQKVSGQTARCLVPYRMAQAAAILLGVAMLVWLYGRRFCSFAFFSYDSILRPGILFLMLTMFICAIRIFTPSCKKEEKLLSGLIVLVILLTSLGSNNGVYPSLNNLFLAAPYTLWELGRFMKNGKDRVIAGVTVSAFPAKAIVTAFLLLCVVQFGGFGVRFVFAEATGVQDTSATVQGNAVLRGIRMSADKAQAIQDLSDYIAKEGLAGQEVILYGNVPALSYYLQMPSAFNPWSDLRSYSRDSMAQALRQLGNEKPVILLAGSYARYAGMMTGVDAQTDEAELSDAELGQLAADEKWGLLCDFIEENGYEQTFRNEKFAVYR